MLTDKQTSTQSDITENNTTLTVQMVNILGCNRLMFSYFIAGETLVLLS